MRTGALPHLIEPRLLSWLGFFAVVLGSWAALFAMGAGLAGHAGAGVLGPGMEATEPLLRTIAQQLDLHHLHAHDSIGMWCLMSIAMMAPTAVPVLATYRDIANGNPQRAAPAGFFGLLTGYLIVWLVYSVTMASTASSRIHGSVFPTSPASSPAEPSGICSASQTTGHSRSCLAEF